MSTEIHKVLFKISRFLKKKKEKVLLQHQIASDKRDILIQSRNSFQTDNFTPSASRQSEWKVTSTMHTPVKQNPRDLPKRREAATRPYRRRIQLSLTLAHVNCTERTPVDYAGAVCSCGSPSVSLGRRVVRRARARAACNLRLIYEYRAARLCNFPRPRSRAMYMPRVPRDVYNAYLARATLRAGARTIG